MVEQRRVILIIFTIWNVTVSLSIMAEFLSDTVVDPLFCFLDTSISLIFACFTRKVM